MYAQKRPASSLSPSSPAMLNNTNKWHGRPPSSGGPRVSFQDLLLSPRNKAPGGVESAVTAAVAARGSFPQQQQMLSTSGKDDATTTSAASSGRGGGGGAGGGGRHSYDSAARPPSSSALRSSNGSSGGGRDAIGFRAPEFHHHSGPSIRRRGGGEREEAGSGENEEANSEAEGKERRTEEGSHAIFSRSIAPNTNTTTITTNDHRLSSNTPSDSREAMAAVMRLGLSEPAGRPSTAGGSASFFSSSLVAVGADTPTRSERGDGATPPSSTTTNTIAGNNNKADAAAIKDNSYTTPARTDSNNNSLEGVVGGKATASASLSIGGGAVVGAPSSGAMTMPSTSRRPGSSMSFINDLLEKASASPAASKRGGGVIVGGGSDGRRSDGRRSDGRRRPSSAFAASLHHYGGGGEGGSALKMGDFASKGSRGSSVVSLSLFSSPFRSPPFISPSSASQPTDVPATSASSPSPPSPPSPSPDASPQIVSDDTGVETSRRLTVDGDGEKDSDGVDVGRKAGGGGGDDVAGKRPAAGEEEEEGRPATAFSAAPTVPPPTSSSTSPSAFFAAYINRNRNASLPPPPSSSLSVAAAPPPLPPRPFQPTVTSTTPRPSLMGSSSGGATLALLNNLNQAMTAGGPFSQKKNKAEKKEEDTFTTGASHSESREKGNAEGAASGAPVAANRGSIFAFGVKEKDAGKEKAPADKAEETTTEKGSSSALLPKTASSAAPSSLSVMMGGAGGVGSRSSSVFGAGATFNRLGSLSLGAGSAYLASSSSYRRQSRASIASAGSSDFYSADGGDDEAGAATYLAQLTAGVKNIARLQEVEAIERIRMRGQRVAAYKKAMHGAASQFLLDDAMFIKRDIFTFQQAHWHALAVDELEMRELAARETLYQQFFYQQELLGESQFIVLEQKIRAHIVGEHSKWVETIRLFINAPPSEQAVLEAICTGSLSERAAALIIDYHGRMGHLDDEGRFAVDGGQSNNNFWRMMLQQKRHEEEAEEKEVQRRKSLRAEAAAAAAAADKKKKKTKNEAESAAAAAASQQNRGRTNSSSGGGGAWDEYTSYMRGFTPPPKAQRPSPFKVAFVIDRKVNNVTPAFEFAVAEKERIKREKRLAAMAQRLNDRQAYIDSLQQSQQQAFRTVSPAPSSSSVGRRAASRLSGGDGGARGEGEDGDGGRGVGSLISLGDAAHIFAGEGALSSRAASASRARPPTPTTASSRASMPTAPRRSASNAVVTRASPTPPPRPPSSRPMSGRPTSSRRSQTLHKEGEGGGGEGGSRYEDEVEEDDDDDGSTNDEGDDENGLTFDDAMPSTRRDGRHTTRNTFVHIPKRPNTAGQRPPVKGSLQYDATAYHYRRPISATNRPGAQTPLLPPAGVSTMSQGPTSRAASVDLDTYFMPSLQSGQQPRRGSKGDEGGRGLSPAASVGGGGRTASPPVSPSQSPSSSPVSSQISHGPAKHVDNPYFTTHFKDLWQTESVARREVDRAPRGSIVGKSSGMGSGALGLRASLLAGLEVTAAAEQQRNYNNHHGLGPTKRSGSSASHLNNAARTSSPPSQQQQQAPRAPSPKALGDSVNSDGVPSPVLGVGERIIRQSERYAEEFLPQRVQRPEPTATADPYQYVVPSALFEYFIQQKASFDEEQRALSESKAKTRREAEKRSIRERDAARSAFYAFKVAEEQRRGLAQPIDIPKDAHWLWSYLFFRELTLARHRQLADASDGTSGADGEGEGERGGMLAWAEPSVAVAVVQSRPAAVLQSIRRGHQGLTRRRAQHAFRASIVASTAFPSSSASQQQQFRARRYT